MVFSDTSDKTGLVQDVDFFCGTNSTTFPLADKAREMNRWYYKVIVDILKSSKRYEFDDSNLTTNPIVTFTLVEGQNDYSLPSNYLKLHAVEIKDAAGNWKRIKETTLQELKSSVTDFRTSSGLPAYYYIFGGSIWFEPAPTATSATLTNGGKFYISREVDVFTASDTTQEPGFAEAFHRILSLGCAYDWLLVNGPESKAASVRTELEQLRSELRAFYSEQNSDVKTRINLAHRQQNYQ